MNDSRYSSIVPGTKQSDAPAGISFLYLSSRLANSRDATIQSHPRIQSVKNRECDGAVCSDACCHYSLNGRAMSEHRSILEAPLVDFEVQILELGLLGLYSGLDESLG